MNLPRDGERIRGIRKTGEGGPTKENYEGVVDFIFASPGPDEPCIKLKDGTHVFPSLGDTWEPVNVT